MKSFVRFFLPISLALLLFSCSDSGDSEDPADTFDRGLMLQNMADNLIIPGFQDLQARVNLLDQAVDNFVQNPSANTLDEAQAQWENAFMSWQQVNSYNFGPGDRSLGTLEVLLGTFPVNTNEIEANIIDPGFDLSSSFNLSIRGFLAIEYLIFGTSDDAAVVTSFTNSAPRGTYLQTLSEDIVSTVNEVNAEWATFSGTFTSQTGTDVGSSTTILFNNFASSFESLKNFKVGLPAGKRPGQTQTEPEQVEAFYSAKSLDAIEAHLNAIENIWRGRSSSGQNGTGFDEYLGSVEGGPALVASTEVQLTAVRSALNDIPNLPLSENIEQNFTAVENLHTQLQQLTRFFKSDMASLLGLSITFNSGDGD